MGTLWADERFADDIDGIIANSLRMTRAGGRRFHLAFWPGSMTRARSPTALCDPMTASITMQKTDLGTAPRLPVGPATCKYAL